MEHSHSHPPSAHENIHFVARTGWLRAAVLGANDGIISVAALLMGVVGAGMPKSALLLTGGAGLVAGALSMAAGEYVSVSSQKDLEKADIERERQHLLEHPEDEFEELAAIYEMRGLNPDTARLVAKELTDHDALDAHIRDELGIHELQQANPIMAAISSAASFSVAALLPIIMVYLTPVEYLFPGLVTSTVVTLGVLGAISAKIGGAPIVRAVVRVTILGIAALLVAYGIGTLFNVPV
ncbi:MAG: VIT family protein [Hellea sp.]|nr:VIT family protein [Hellea sp.]